jgi:hypothetical protein
LWEQGESIAPLEPELIAIHFGSRIGIPPRAMAQVLEYPDGRKVSEMLQNFKRHLERNPILSIKLDALGIL